MKTAITIMEYHWVLKKRDVLSAGDDVALLLQRTRQLVQCFCRYQRCIRHLYQSRFGGYGPEPEPEPQVRFAISSNPEPLSRFGRFGFGAVRTEPYFQKRKFLRYLFPLKTPLGQYRSLHAHSPWLTYLYIRRSRFTFLSNNTFRGVYLHVYQ